MITTQEDYNMDKERSLEILDEMFEKFKLAVTNSFDSGQIDEMEIIRTDITMRDTDGQRFSISVYADE